MTNAIMVVIVSIAIAVTSSIGYITLTRMKNIKREFFLLYILSMIFYELGYLFEMTASSADGGLMAMKVMYMGSGFVAPLFFLFIQQYCEIKMPRFVNALFVGVAAFTMALVWTNNFHTLHYASYWYDDVSAVHQLGVTHGPLYMFNIVCPTICAFTTFFVLLKQRHGASKERKRRLNILCFAAIAPFITLILYSVKILGINFAPVFWIGYILLLYFGLVRYDLLENEETMRSQAWFKDMVAHISHDLKTPLAILSANLESLSWLAETQSDDAYQRHVRTAYQKNLDLQRLIQNLLEVSRIETGRNIHNPRRVSSLDLLSKMNDKYGGFLEDAGIDLNVVAEGDFEILTDSQKIWSVFDNIIYNAARHTGSGGSITVAANNNATSTITITDTGCGIEPERLPHIFERFYKGSHSRGEKEGDSGLGLFIVKSIMEGSGGIVAAESEPGKGTSIILTFSSKLPD